MEKTESSEEFAELEQMVYKTNVSLDLAWKHRLLKKHENVEELKRELDICLGYVNSSHSQDIIDQLITLNILDKYVETTEA